MKVPFTRSRPRSLLLIGALVSLASPLRAAEAAEAGFKKSIEPILAEYCYDCHADGMDKGQVAFDGFQSTGELLADHRLWQAVLKNVRAGLMPPEKKKKPGPEEVATLERWIKGEVFGIDPANPDPGRVTLRRLNRAEYRSTIRDLMGVDFRADEEFPPDDTGYGFDNIGDVLTISPLLLEKYMQAAETIVTEAVPMVSRVVAEERVAGREFRTEDGKATGERISFYQATRVAHPVTVKQPGTYRLTLDLTIRGAFDFDPGRATVTARLGERELFEDTYKWEERRPVRPAYEFTLEPGEHPLSFELKPLTPAEERKTSVDLLINFVKLEGPLEKEHWVRPKNFGRFFTGDFPESLPERRAQARELLSRFTSRAYRRPVDERTLERLTAIAEATFSEPGKTFQEGISRALVAVLASPRFVFRVEGEIPADQPGRHPLVDEYALASRLAYFLWGTMPDDELFALAGRGELRTKLHAQVRRMLADPRATDMIRNFTGQWLQVRDVEGIAINEKVVLARDKGEDRELERLRAEFRAQLGRQGRRELTPEQREARRKLFAPAEVELNGELRRAMREETELAFAHLVREDRSVLELLDADYTFLNERLAKHYGVPDVKGSEMRLVKLPADSPRGGVLTHGSVLVVTSNPTRTSPVKRGLFVLDNLLGTPAPPPPADVPELEELEKGITDHEPTLREVLELHRDKPICKSCHQRMDPLGLALENFNALGMWRDQERGQPVDAASQLITGEAFPDIRRLKQILARERRMDFYRCLTEKFLTFALGRGLEYQDTHTVDQIVDRLDQDGGKFSSLLLGVIESAPFQKRRLLSPAAPGTPARGDKPQVQASLQP